MIPQLDVSRSATKADLVQAGTGVRRQDRSGSRRRNRRLRDRLHETGLHDGGGRDADSLDLGCLGGRQRRECANLHLSRNQRRNLRRARPERPWHACCRDLPRAEAGPRPDSSGWLPVPTSSPRRPRGATDATASFAGDDVIAAISYIFQQAQALGKPAVVNLSLGGTSSRPLDGTTNYEQAISNLTGPGKIIVAGRRERRVDAGSSLLWRPGFVVRRIRSRRRWVPASDNSKGYAYLWYGTGSISVGIAARRARPRTRAW